MIEIKPTEACQFDILSLGEVMLRLDPGEGRIRTSRHFTAWEGGGEYNVARGLKRCFGMRAALVSAFADNEVGRLLENLMLTGGVDLTHVQWVAYDGVGRASRNGLNFTERGFGVRSALGNSDRGHTAASQLKPGDIDWDHIFGEQGVRWFHTGGIFAGLSDTTPQVIEEALTSARKYGTITSYDLNYRASLWNAFGGQDNCQRLNRKIAPLVDVMIGNEEDFTACLGLQVSGVDAQMKSLPIEGFQSMIQQATREFPTLQVIATTMRTVHTATVNDWKALCWQGGEMYVSGNRPQLEILDRVGGGDSFASGLIYGLLTGQGPQRAVDYGAAHGALAMTTPGDTSMANLAEVEALMSGQSARVKR
ncbi:MAG: sugar kinase [Mariniblastus sp.]|nr:sugar kinase [Mariniblastus sp.]